MFQIWLYERATVFLGFVYSLRLKHWGSFSGVRTDYMNYFSQDYFFAKFSNYEENNVKVCQ